MIPFPGHSAPLKSRRCLGLKEAGWAGERRVVTYTGNSRKAVLGDTPRQCLGQNNLSLSVLQEYESYSGPGKSETQNAKVYSLRL